MRRLKLVLFAAAVSLCLPHSAGAESYPDRPIRIIVPTGTGGAADIISRMIAEKLQTSLGQPVIVEDRPGANGIVGASYVLSAPADGYMLMMGHIGLMTINNHIYKDVKFDPLTDFAPVTLATTYPNLLVVNNKLPIHSVAELVEYARKNPDALKYSSSGFGASFHMAFELLKAKTGINAVHIPYTGTAVALTAVIAGNVDTTFTDTITSAPQIEGKTLRGIAISSKTRAKTLPDIPTVAESGVPGLADFEVLGWNGIVVKTGTPPDRIKLLNEHLRRALTAPDVVERVSKLGADVAAGTPEEFGAFMRAEDTKWGNLAKTAKLQAVE
jgi:tripartite-type tricarboxylate transporter receptor subunit TctC